MCSHGCGSWTLSFKPSFFISHTSNGDRYISFFRRPQMIGICTYQCYFRNFLCILSQFNNSYTWFVGWDTRHFIITNIILSHNHYIIKIINLSWDNIYLRWKFVLRNNGFNERTKDIFWKLNFHNFILQLQMNFRYYFNLYLFFIFYY